MIIKTKIKRIIEKLIPFSVITTTNKTAIIPAYIGNNYIELRTKKKKIIIFKKIKNSYSSNDEFNHIRQERIEEQLECLTIRESKDFSKEKIREKIK